MAKAEVKKPRVLLVLSDGNRLLGEQLKGLGCDVIDPGHLKDAAAAVEEIHRHEEAGFILLDLLGEEDWRKAEEVLKYLCEWEKAKVVFISGDESDRDAAREDLGVHHTAGLYGTSIMRCIRGECGCKPRPVEAGGGYEGG